nr:MAG TPA: hypothetical protein [Caudoviricetes sp.]
MKEKDVLENINSNFYIIDCEDFIFYARRVRITRIWWNCMWVKHRFLFGL